METTEIELNIPQADIHLVNANKTYVLWGRATGKSNGGLGPRTIHLMDKMPGAQIGFVAPSYKMAFGQILPNIIGFWQNEMGLVEGENYVIGCKPPGDWPKPKIPILNHQYVVSVDNGCAMPVLSLEAEGTGNGFNLQAIVADETKYFKEKKLKAEVLRAIRGCKKDFAHLPEFQSQWYFTDKFGGDIEWMLAKRKLMNKDLINAVIRIQLEVNEMRMHLQDTTRPSPSLERGWGEVNKYEALLNNIRKDLVFVSEASAEENRVILGDKYFQSQKEDSTEIEYNVAILNQDPSKVENSFYPQLSENNLYRTSLDVDPSKALIIAADYQWRISPIATAQIAELPAVKYMSLNFVYSCYTLHPEGLGDAIEKWAHHFRNHYTKIVYYLFDKTATNKSPTAAPYYETVIDKLQSLGWSVIAENMGEPPLHTTKFRTINDQLKGEVNKLPVRINALQNEDMLTSINLTAAINYNGQTKKNKTGEKNTSIPAVKTTHFSDTFDMIFRGVLDLDLVPQNTGGGLGMIIS